MRGDVAHRWRQPVSFLLALDEFEDLPLAMGERFHKRVTNNWVFRGIFGFTRFDWLLLSLAAALPGEKPIGAGSFLMWQAWS